MCSTATRVQLCKSHDLDRLATIQCYAVIGMTFRYRYDADDLKLTVCHCGLRLDAKSAI